MACTILRVLHPAPNFATKCLPSAIPSQSHTIIINPSLGVGETILTVHDVPKERLTTEAMQKPCAFNSHHAVAVKA